MQLGKSATSTDIVDSYWNSPVAEELNHAMNPVFDAVQNAQLQTIDLGNVVSEELYNYVHTISTKTETAIKPLTHDYSLNNVTSKNAWLLQPPPFSPKSDDGAPRDTPDAVLR
jgi:hypothetical protein